MRGRAAGDPSVDRRSRRDRWGVVLDAPDPTALGHFYSELLGWQIAEESAGHVAMGPDNGVAYLAIQRESNYVRPAWPAAAGDQQMMMHLDFEVDDLEVAVAHAVELGAEVADYKPQDDVRVMLDPVGHPFCLYT